MSKKNNDQSGAFERYFGLIDKKYGGRGLIVAIALIAVYFMWKRLEVVTDKWIETSNSQTLVNQKVANQLEAMTAIIGVNTERISQNTLRLEGNSKNIESGVDMVREILKNQKEIHNK